MRRKVAPSLGGIGARQIGCALYFGLCEIEQADGFAVDAHALLVYPDTPHAFHADYRPSYRKAQADDGWKRANYWFRKHLN